LSLLTMNKNTVVN